MNGHYYYSNPGAVLRQIFPKQLNTQALILIWTVVFILNLVIVVLIQNVVIFPITDVSKDGIKELSYFENCEIKGVNVALGNNREPGDYHVTYINENGELRIVFLKEFPVDFIQRARIIKSSDMEMTEDGMIQYQKGTEEKQISMSEYIKLVDSDSIFDIVTQHDKSQLLIGIYLAIGVGMLLFEFFIYSVFHRLFRE